MTSKKTPSDNYALRYTRLFEAAQDGILLLDFPEGLIEDANPYILNLIGYSKDELVGKKLWEIGFISNKEKALKAQKSIVDEGYVRFEDLDLQTKKGDRLPVEFICNSYRLDGDIVIQCNIRDISARREVEKQLSIEQARVIGQLYETVNSLSNVIEARDLYTAGHQKRVADLSVEIAKKIGMSANEIDGLRFAALIHDIGKIGIPIDILTKPYALTPLEIALLRGHAQAGYDILKPLTFPWPIAEIVLQHHERLNGSGYPNALKAEAICLEARILAVADTVEAMSSNRPYRAALGEELALKEIELKSGVLFDGRVVKACLKLFREDGYKFPPAYSSNYQSPSVREG
jgi:PAS domain S-box-containing protein